MGYAATQTAFRISASTLIALAAGLTAARADLLQPTATLPPPAGLYGLPLVCITPVCLENANVSGFQDTLDLLSGGNELVSTTAIFAAEIFQNSGGSPGADLGPLSIAGTMNLPISDGRSLLRWVRSMRRSPILISRVCLTVILSKSSRIQAWRQLVKRRSTKCPAECTRSAVSSTSSQN